MMRILILGLMVAVRALQKPDIHECDKDEFKTCARRPNYRRYCDADGTVLKDGHPRTICAPVNVLQMVFSEKDYCGQCNKVNDVPEVAPSVPPVTSQPAIPETITGAPIVSTDAPIASTSAPIVITDSPITLVPSNAPITKSPITRAPITAAPITGSPVTSPPVSSEETMKEHSDMVEEKKKKTRRRL